MKVLSRLNYNTGSGGELMKNLGVKRMNSSGNSIRNAIIINWGVGDAFSRTLENCIILNKPESIKLTTSKLKTAEILKKHGIPVVKCFVDLELAKKYLEDGQIVFHRRDFLSQGKGIRVYYNPLDITAPLEDKEFFSLYKEHTSEYRVHVFGQTIIDGVRKKRMSQEMIVEKGLQYNPLIKNHDNGWVFGREDVFINSKLKMLAIQTLEVLGLSFGAVDIVATVKDGVMTDATVLEVNSAPGLEGTTLELYTNTFSNFINQF